MVFFVTFTGRTPIAPGGTDQIWTYTVRAEPPDAIPPGQRIALAFPVGTPVRDPGSLADVAALADMFLQQDPASSRIYAGTVALGDGTETIAFAAPFGDAQQEVQQEVLLVSRASGAPWTALPYATAAGAVVDVAHNLPAPAPTPISPPPSFSGRPITDFKGVLPYSSELFGVYQPLIGWRSALSGERLADATARRFNRSAALAWDRVNLDTARLAGEIAAPRPTDRTGTSVGQALAGHAAAIEISGQLHDWQATLVGSPDSPLSRAALADPGVTRAFYRAGHGQPLQAGPTDTSLRETATATLLHYLGQISPSTVAQMFADTIDPWRRLLASADWFATDTPSHRAFLAPIGILHMFREYFFELGTFLGPPVGHVWLSPGGTVELIEVNTRRTLVEQTVEQTTETTNKTELATTDRDELSDAVKVENANDTKLGVTATGSGGVAGVYQASASGSLNLDSTRKQAQEQTHKQMREQSAKLSSEVRQNFKTTFRTVTETTDTSSRRYVLQNTTSRLVSYELSRKMRKVGVQVQDLGRQLCWQLYVDNPGDTLGLGEFVHAASSALDPGVKPPDLQPYPDNKQVTYNEAIPFVLFQGADHDANDTYQPEGGNPDHGIFEPDAGKNDIILFKHTFTLPPPPTGFQLVGLAHLDFHGADVKFTVDAADLLPNPDPATNSFTIRLTYANFGGRQSLPFDVAVNYEPTADAKKKIDDQNAAAKTTYDDQVAVKKEQLFYDTLRARLKLVGKVVPRPEQDLREEERDVVYRFVIARLYGSEADWGAEDFHVAAELIRYLFDVDSMLYFVAPDWWRPRAQQLASKDAQGELQPTIIADEAVSERVIHFGKNHPVVLPGHRPYYLITEETQPAPMGSSLGWLIQLDGDTHRNAFLNSPWVKAVLPIRPGREREALAWLRRPEVVGTAGLDEPYPYVPAADPPEFQGLTIEQVLLKLADKIAAEHQVSLTPVPVDKNAVNPQLALPAETVFAHGFDPLEGGIAFGADAFKVFSQWIEILPTDQVVATEYDLKGL